MFITQCPHCDTVFEATVDQLMRAGGRARCGQCHEAFDALINLRDRLPETALPDTPRPGFCRNQVPGTPGFLEGAILDEEHSEIGSEYVEEDETRQEPDSDPTPVAHTGPVFDLSDLPPLDDSDLAFDDSTFSAALEEDGFVPQRPEAPPPPARILSPISRTLAWGAGSILLTLALLAQGMLSRQAIAGFPPLRAFAESVCNIAGCTMPLPRESASLSLVSRDVQPHPSVEGALLISATMINRASHPQEWPMLEITLADLNGNLLTMRRFGPEVYLSSGIDRAAGMPPNTPIHVVFETEDPGDDAVAFEFQFR